MKSNIHIKNANCYIIAKTFVTKLIKILIDYLGIFSNIADYNRYLTGGSPRKINIQKDRGILFKHTTKKNLAFQNKFAHFSACSLLVVV